MITPCPRNWTGTIEEFFDQFVIPNWPDPEIARCVHNQIGEYIAANSTFFVRDLTGGGTARGVELPQFNGQIFNCDNAPAIWHYTKMKFEEDYADTFLYSAILNHQLPLKDLGARPGEENYVWSRTSADPQQIRTPNGGRWKLCHIYSVKRDLPTDTQWLKKRFVRLMHPFNQFLFPRPNYLGKGYYPIGSDLGEAKYICEYAKGRITEIVGEKYFNEFLILIGANEFGQVGTKDLNSTIDLILHWHEKRNINAEIQVAQNHNDMEINNGNENFPILYITETPSGKFNFQGFGVGIGGQNRDQQFVIKVYNQVGALIAQSQPVTAQELGIASAGRSDYDRNRFSNSNFLIKTEAGQLIPGTALARRVPWIILTTENAA